MRCNMEESKGGKLLNSGVHRLFEGQGRKEKKGTYNRFSALKRAL